MYIVDIEKGTVTKAHVGHKEHCPIMEAVDRLKEELEGWKMYKKMADHAEGKETSKVNYTRASEQEFQHALLAMSDLAAALKAAAAPGEQEQLHRLITELPNV